MPDVIHTHLCSECGEEYDCFREDCEIEDDEYNMCSLCKSDMEDEELNLDIEDDFDDE